MGAGASRTRIYRTSEEVDPLILVNNGNDVRIAEMAIDGNAAASSAAEGLGIRINNTVNFRVDHCSFLDHGAAGVRASGSCQGVVDHCSFDKIYKAPIANLGYGVVIMGTGKIENVPFGSAKATFVEDSGFSACRHAVASNNGARYVFRHNTVHNNVVSHAIDAHGQEYGSVVGTEWVDVNNNQVTNPVYTINAVRIRGGKGVVWKNTFTGYDFGVGLIETTPQATGPVYIWGNTVTHQQVNAGAGTDYHLSAMPGYKEYPYPHTLASALVARAGPDIQTMSAGALTEVYVDGTGSKAATGTVKAWRWRTKDGLISSCARDVVELGLGLHTLLLEVERDDGLLSHDTAVIEVMKPSIVSNAVWNDRWFRPIVGQGTARFSVVPSAVNMDGYVALTGRHPVAAHADNAIIVRANSTGHFDAYNGTAYAAVNVIPYAASKTYQVVIDVDVAAQTYSATIDGVAVAKDYAFRLKESSIGQINAWSAVGTLTAADLQIDGALAQPDPACAPTPDGGTGGSGGSVSDGGAETGQAGAWGLDASHGGDSPPDRAPDSVGAADSAAGSASNADGSSDGGCGCKLSEKSTPSMGAMWLLVACFCRRRPRLRSSSRTESTFR
jgi:hypothetical protein